MMYHSSVGKLKTTMKIQIEVLTGTEHYLDKNDQFDHLGRDAVASMLEYDGVWKLHAEHVIFPLLV